MVKLVIPYVIIVGAFLTKVSLLWPMPLFSVLCDVSHLFGCFINLLLKLSQPKHLLPYFLDLLMNSFVTPGF
jgi:hypothetical protein